MAQGNATATTLDQSVGYSSANTLQYAINQALMNVNTILPCKILAITGSTYTVQPLNNIISADGTPIAPPVLSNIPACITMGGNAGIIIEYVINDTVLVGFCQRDITTIKQSWLLSNPASFRKFSLSDGVIISKLSNSLPTIYVKVTASGVEINAPSLPVTVNSQSATINAETVALGNNASNAILLQDIPLAVSISGIVGGPDTVVTTMTVTGGGSTTVTASI